MCFSPEMDAVAGTVITVIGVDALYQVRSLRYVPLASLPLLFGVHQLMEALVWLRLEGRLGSIGTVATTAYAAVAFVLIPMLVPSAFAAAGLVRRRFVAYAELLCGVVAGGMGLWGMASGPVAARIVGHHIAYDAHIPDVAAMLTLYIVATCSGPLLARSRSLQVWGVANLVAVFALIATSRSGLTSLWCVWAAITSVVIDLHIRGLFGRVGETGGAGDSSRSGAARGAA